MSQKKAKQPAVKTNTAKPVERPLDGISVLKIDGKEYRLFCDFNTLAEHEPMTGCNLLHAIPAFMLNTLSALQLRGLLYAALQRFQPYRAATKDRAESGIGLLAAGQMVRVDTMPDIYDALGLTDLTKTGMGSNA